MKPSPWLEEAVWALVILMFSAGLMAAIWLWF